MLRSSPTQGASIQHRAVPSPERDAAGLGAAVRHQALRVVQQRRAVEADAEQQEGGIHRRQALEG